MRKPMVAGNWKMNGDEALLDAHVKVLGGLDLSNVDVALCPPFVFMPAAQKTLDGTAIAWGAQDASDQEKGAFTGQISANMLGAFGCKYVIIGHSERRALCAESNEIVAEKFAQVQAAGLTPILCVGETDFQHERGQTQQVVLGQIHAVIERSGITALGNAVIAYEPVWAIGTGKAATPEQAQAVHRSIRDFLAQHDRAVADQIRILYGGSVNDENAATLFGQPDIDGGLIGGASLKPEAFATIVKATG